MRFLDLKEIISFFTAFESVGTKIKIFWNLLVFSTGFDDGSWALLARVLHLTTNEKYLLETF